MNTLKICLCLSLLLSGCEKKEEEEVDLDQMVLNEEDEAEWTSESKEIAGEMFPLPQEQLQMTFEGP